MLLVLETFQWNFNHIGLIRGGPCFKRFGAELGRHHDSAVISQIHTNSSLLPLSREITPQPSGLEGYCHTSLGKWLPDFMECISLKPLDRFSPFKVLRNFLDLKLCGVIVICPFAPYGLTQRPKICWKLGIVLDRRCALLRSLAHQGRMWAKKSDHYLKQWWPSLVTHICIIWPLWVNPLRPSNAYMHQ